MAVKVKAERPPVGDRFFESIFESWISKVFDHTYHPKRSKWWEELEAPVWDTETHPELTLRMLARLFRQPEILIGRFTPEQIDEGVWFLNNGLESSHLDLLLNERLPWELRHEVVEGVFSLYERLFSRICEPVVGGGGSPNNSVYMFWDMFPLSPSSLSVPGPLGRPDGMDMVCLDVMARILEIPHVACQQGALHGLGHWHERYPKRVQGIVDEFLAKHPDVDSRLRAYAVNAREGEVQ